MIFNNKTIYKGFIYPWIEKYSDYSSGTDKYNNTLLDLGFIKLVTRIRTKRKNTEKYNLPLLKKIEKQVGLILVTVLTNWNGDNRTEKDGLHDGIGNIKDENYLCAIPYFKNKTGENIPLSFGFMAYKNNMIGTNHPQVFQVKGQDKFYGYSHRGGGFCKIGDRFFDENYIPKAEDYTEEEWNSYLKAYEEMIERDVAEGDFLDKETARKNMDVSWVIPWNMRGNRIVETRQQAFESALNIALSLS